MVAVPPLVAYCVSPLAPMLTEMLPSVWPPTATPVSVIDGVVGDYLCEKFGDLKAQPLSIQVKGNRLIEAHSANKELKDDFWAYTHKDENSNRVGEFAIGTNVACTHVIGNILQDEKIPGIHIAFGHPYAEHTGANWFSPIHAVAKGSSDSQNSNTRLAHSTLPDTRAEALNMW